MLRGSRGNGKKGDVRHKKTKETIFKWSSYQSSHVVLWRCDSTEMRGSGVVWCGGGATTLDLGERRERCWCGRVTGEQRAWGKFEGDREIPALRTEQNNFKIRRCSKTFRAEFSLFKQWDVRLFCFYRFPQTLVFKFCLLRVMGPFPTRDGLYRPGIELRWGVGQSN